MSNKSYKPDAVFEISWEVCNKVGGIHTVISTKTLSFQEKICLNHIFIGPELWRESAEHPEFIEDNELFNAWKEKAFEEGLSVKTGRWDIPGNPAVILVDFSTFIIKKDEIFAHFWELYKLDSLSGQWDYIEPALFGYAAGKVVESFVNFNFPPRHKVIAQFHEWMTGTGILYLEDVMPRIGTVFTTHATALGRCISGNGLPLYENISQYNSEALAHEFNVASKHSLEKLSAINADVFTTVSEITGNECRHFFGKEVDLITPNGFENSFVPDQKVFDKKKKAARVLLTKVAETLVETKIDNNTLLIATSGRYEFSNKGYNIYIDALGALNKNKELNRNIVAFLLVPANNYGARKELYNRLYEGGTEVIENNVLTHNLHDPDCDPVISSIKRNELFNRPEDKVKVIFVPSYLNGNDGIFNVKYYDLLIGFDITVFASYYEPWGYTPMESIAFGVPTISTTLAGFGKWVKDHMDKNNESVFVIDRNDNNYNQVVDAIVNRIIKCSGKSADEKNKVNESAKDMSDHFLWKNLITYYEEAYKLAFMNVEKRKEKIVDVQTTVNPVAKQSESSCNKPQWRKIDVQVSMPERFKGLSEIAHNTWWFWNYNAMELFKFIDLDLWRESSYNPIIFLENVTANRLRELETDDIYTKKYDEVYAEYIAYMEKGNEKKGPKVAYFSMEFGLNDTLKIFSGGLGILAGDYLKEASDCNVNMFGLGLLYRHGYFSQTLSVSGEQQATYVPQDFSRLPVSPVRDSHGNLLVINVKLPGRNVYVKVWKALVGRVDLFLLDTDHELNQEADRMITHQLYGGNNENRLKQEMILGIGGIRAINELKLKPDIYHCNEGHAAFIGLERLRVLRTKRNLKFNEALEIIRASTLFTTHTPVPAGHDAFDENLLRVYMSHYPERLKITWEEMMNLGIKKPGDKFSMSNLAVSLSQEVNGVSRLHGEVSKKMFAELWEGYFSQESHIGYVTNGVHYQSWTAKAWKLLYEKEFGQGFTENLSDSKYWKKIHNVPDETIWDIRLYQRFKLIEYVRNRVRKNWVRTYENPKNIVEVINNIDEKVLTIGFARRFALLNNKAMPVQILFAGKAHPHDKAGQDLIKMIVEISKRPQFLGKIVFLENYDIELARKMVQGVDIWMNTPTRPLEASGTSGMKAVMNGALHFSVLDGWWCEGYRPEAGWALPEERTYQNQDFQDELDAETIYALLENEIVPLFYKRNEKGIPVGWVKYIKNSLAAVAPQFTTKRMMDDYYERYYNKLYKRSVEMKKNDYELAIQIAEWKANAVKMWNDIEIISVDIPDYMNHPIKITDQYEGTVKININGFKPEEIGVELVIADKITDNETHIFSKYEGEITEQDGNIVTYKIQRLPVKAGTFNYSIRVFVKNELLPYRQDLPLVKWI